MPLPRLFSVFVILFLAICASAQQNLRQPLITQPINESRVVTLKGNTHPLAQRQFDMGAAPPDLPMDRMLLVLKRDPQQDYTLGRLLDDQQDKNSPNYHKWMTPTTFGTQFGASDQDIQLVTGWLQTHGFQINRVSNGRSVIEFSGVEAQVEQAFRTQIHQYMLPNGEQHWANASDPQIPAALVPAVAGVWSMHDFRKKSNLVMDNSRYSVSPGSSPLFTSNTGRHALMPGDFATIYNISPLYAQGINGQGTHIAVVARSNINTGDPYSFWSQASIPMPTLNVFANGPDPGIFDINEEFEAVLDATWSGSVAPGATINFVVSASTNTTDGVDLSSVYIVDNNVGDVMTESFGLCEAYFTSAEAQAVSALAQQAAAEGITSMVSAGDNGAEGCVNPNASSANNAPLGVNMLASSQYTVAVGGTMFNDTSNPATYWSSTNGAGITSAKSYIPENVWNESCPTCGLWAGSGGASSVFSKPNWQFGVSGIPNDGARDLPDVSLTAAGHDPYLICITTSQGQCFYGVGGTSASAPSFAGIMALIVQQYGRQGLANYILYRLASTETLSQCNASSTTGLPASTCIFNDVTKGNNAVPGEAGYGTTSAKFQAGVGYDLATGLGSVNVTNLVTKWNTVTFNATSTTLGPSTVSGTHGSPMTLNISVSPSSGTGTPTGDVSLQANTAPGANNGRFLTLANGSVSAPVNNLSGGSYTLTAHYGGDSNFAPSTSNGIQVNITPENSTTSITMLALDPNRNLVVTTSGSYGSFIYPRADVAGQSRNGVPTGFVSFLDNANGFSSLPLNSQGNTAFPNGCWGCFNAGQHSITAQYGGDSSFKSSTSPPFSYTVTPATTSTSISASPTGGAQGITISLTANISSSAFAGASNIGNYPSGTVTFWSGTTQVGSVPVFANGPTQNGIAAIASLSTQSLPNGADSIAAQYTGDTNYSASSSSAVIVNISADFTFAPGNSNLTVAQGGSTTDVLTITGQTGYSNTVNFTSASCKGLPTLTTCSFNPASVVGSGTTTVSIRTTAPSSAALHHGVGFTALGFVFAGVLLMGVPSRRFRSHAALSIVLCMLVIGSVACGGGSGGGGGGGNPGTLKGTYNITLTATTIDQAVSHTTTFTLAVQ